jgi:CheY-like chemotaxis protein
MAQKSPMETTILLLTSEPVARLVIQEVLERAGYAVMATGDLGTAVDRLKEYGQSEGGLGVWLS